MPIQLSEFPSFLITPLFLIASLFIKHQTYNTELPLAPARVQTQMSNKHNLVLYVDQELVEKSRELGFNLSKTFENHLKHLLMQFSQVNSSNNNGNNDKIIDWWAGPDLNRRPSARQADVLTELDYRPPSGYFLHFPVCRRFRFLRARFLINSYCLKVPSIYPLRCLNVNGVDPSCPSGATMKLPAASMLLLFILSSILNVAKSEEFLVRTICQLTTPRRALRDALKVNILNHLKVSQAGVCAVTLLEQMEKSQYRWVLELGVCADGCA